MLYRPFLFHNTKREKVFYQRHYKFVRRLPTTGDTTTCEETVARIVRLRWLRWEHTHFAPGATAVVELHLDAMLSVGLLRAAADCQEAE